MLSESRIAQIVVEIVKPHDGQLNPDSSLGTTEGWDSLAQLEIITRLEQESGVRLSAEDAIYAESLSDLVSLFASQEKSSD
jgi:acyl carrier protein